MRKCVSYNAETRDNEIEICSISMKLLSQSVVLLYERISRHCCALTILKEKVLKKFNLVEKAKQVVLNISPCSDLCQRK